MVPAIGALNVAEMAAAAPLPTRILSRSPENLNKDPITELTGALMCTIGPSRPTEQPDPMQIADAKALAGATRPRMLPSCVAAAAITSWIPEPRAYLTRHVTSPTSRPPAAGDRGNRWGFPSALTP